MSKMNINELFESKFHSINDKVLINNADIQLIKSNVIFQDNINLHESQKIKGFLKPSELSAYEIQISISNDPQEIERLMNGMSK
jgi:hypothetical protein